MMRVIVLLASPLVTLAPTPASAWPRTASRRAMIVWAFVVLGFLSFGDGQPSLMGQANHKLLGRFVLPTRAACEAAREGVREFAETANQTLLIGRCLEEARATLVSAELGPVGRH